MQVKADKTRLCRSARTMVDIKGLTLILLWQSLPIAVRQRLLFKDNHYYRLQSSL